ncbi:hypothetical protein ABLE68_11705 [Nocardioides sp. CN2-186]|uniref:hypothetical protein n=1 Tax=Nocardioides tweenelious TaxID=3156607 RepID=UPI0032B544FD
MTPTADDFHALARSSPWRWTTLHLRARSSRWHVEAWLARPDGVRIVDPAGAPVTLNLEAQRPGGSPTRPWVPASGGDGLYWENYSWLAMLDPVELSHDVALARLREDEVAGRPVWRADVTALPGYDPRCSCCALIWCEIADVYEWGDTPGWTPLTDAYPDHYDVALDVQTGIVVRCLPVGGSSDAFWLENDILEAC